MELTKFIVNKNTLTGTTLGLNLTLKSSFNDIDFYTDLSQDLTVSAQTVTTNLTGYTSDKLKKIRSYNYNNPYIIGVNGVTALNDNYIQYSIDNINYITYFSGATIFQFSNVTYNYVNFNFIGEEDKINYVDEIQIDNQILIERQTISVIENFSKLRQIASVEDFTTFSNSFYTINDQTI